MAKRSRVKMSDSCYGLHVYIYVHTCSCIYGGAAPKVTQLINSLNTVPSMNMLSYPNAH